MPRKGRCLNYYIAGFVDGEGSFSVSIKKHPTAKFGWVLDPVFQVYQHKKDIEVLEIIKRRFQTGYIKPKSPTSNVMVYIVSNRLSLKEKIIPFFEKYRLLTSKWEDFQIFREIIFRMEAKEHWKKEGLINLIKLAGKMNRNGKQRKYDIKRVIKEIEEKR